MLKHYNINLIRYFQAYSMDDLAALYKIDNSTIRRWIHKEGLTPIDGKQPYLFYGQELKAFFGKLNTKHKHKLKINQMFCFKCRMPQIPYKRNVFITPHMTIIKIKGICPLCKTVMNVSRSLSEYAELKRQFYLKPLEELELFNSKTPCVNKRILNQDVNKKLGDEQMDLFERR